MNYVILNGVKSTTIKGLLIQSLPPISKPLIRTEVEEIDGRDGDIITKLGYSAYDKDMKIGLFGEYDVNDVIKYFDSEGTVTFSNEPDKYYKYEIIEQIDLERLIRFKTATVTFHVQPFKYSAVEKPVTFNKQLLTFDDYTTTKNGVTLTAQNGTVSLSGTPTTATEFYMPIHALSMTGGNYKLSAVTNGAYASACSIRLIGSVPSDADSFGGTFLGLQNNAVVSMSSSANKTFNYLWFYITAGNQLDFSMTPAVVNNGDDSISVMNLGNTLSKPKITIYGSGTIRLSLNGTEVFTISLGTDEFITLDVAEMNATKNGILKNRLVAGNYDNLAFPVGRTTLTWTGNVTKIEIENYTRWI